MIESFKYCNARSGAEAICCMEQYVATRLLPMLVGNAILASAHSFVGSCHCFDVWPEYGL